MTARGRVTDEANSFALTTTLQNGERSTSTGRGGIIKAGVGE
jgi:hypothetical protein